MKTLENMIFESVHNSANGHGSGYMDKHKNEKMLVRIIEYYFRDGKYQEKVALVSPMSTPNEHYLRTSPIVEVIEETDKAFSFITESGTTYRFRKEV